MKVPRARWTRQCCVCHTDVSAIWYRNAFVENTHFCKRCQNWLRHLVERKNWQPDYAYEWMIENSDHVINVRRLKEEYRKSVAARQCYTCGSKTTHIDKTGRRQWLLNRDINGNVTQVLCHKCAMKYIKNPKRKPQIWQYWKGKEIPLKYNPRTGFCSRCGKTGQTQLHHTSYESDNPLDNTIELCISCHSKIPKRKILVP